MRRPYVAVAIAGVVLSVCAGTGVALTGCNSSSTTTTITRSAAPQGQSSRKHERRRRQGARCAREQGHHHQDPGEGGHRLPHAEAGRGACRRIVRRGAAWRHAAFGESAVGRRHPALRESAVWGRRRRHTVLHGSLFAGVEGHDHERSEDSHRSGAQRGHEELSARRQCSISSMELPSGSTTKASLGPSPSSKNGSRETLPPAATIRGSRASMSSTSKAKWPKRAPPS